MSNKNDYKKYNSLYAKHITFKQYKKIGKYKEILIKIDNNLDLLKRTFKIIENDTTITEMIKLELRNEIHTQHYKYKFWKDEYENYLKKNKLFNFYNGCFNNDYNIDECSFNEICCLLNKLYYI